MYKTLLKNILLPVASLFFSGNYSRYLKQWKVFDGMTAEALHAHQQEKLNALLKYAKEHVPYYKNLDLNAADSIADLPILTKEILREHSDSLLSDEFQKDALRKNHSSGSSGVQSVTYMTSDHLFYLRALQTHWWSWGGFEPGEPLLQAGMSLKRGFVKQLKDFFFRVRYMNAFQLTDLNISTNLGAISSKNPKHLAGYPSALNEIAKYALEHDKKTKFTSVISYGDKLFDGFRRNFEKAFDHPTIINTYGCAEGYYMACTADLPYYYIMSPHVYLEVVDDSGTPVPDGEMGHILVTGLTNLAMPLIRYKVGDLGVILLLEEYPKERRFQYPLLKTVIGRETDVIKTPNGNTLIVHSFTGIIEFYTEIEQFKVIQTQKDAITIQFRSKKELPTSTQDAILEQLDALTENSMKFTFERVENIKASPSGKPQIIEIRNTT